jgi:hypothetical protein
MEQGGGSTFHHTNDQKIGKDAQRGGQAVEYPPKKQPPVLIKFI